MCTGSWIVYWVLVLVNSLLMLRMAWWIGNFERGHAQDGHRGPLRRSSDPEWKSIAPEGEREPDSGRRTRSIDGGMRPHGTWGESVNGELEGGQDERSDEYKSERMEGTSVSPNFQPSPTISQLHHLYWIPQRSSITDRVVAMDLSYPSTPPPPTPHPIYPRTTSLRVSDSPRPTQRYEGVQPRRGYGRPGARVNARTRPRTQHQSSGGLSTITDVRAQFSTNQLLYPRNSSPSNDPDLPVGLRRIRPLPRRARLAQDPNRPPTPYPHLDGVIVEAIQRLQAATIEGVSASPPANLMPQPLNEPEDVLMEQLEDAPVGISPTPIASPSSSTQVPTLASLTEVSMLPGSIAFQPTRMILEPSTPTTAFVSQQIVQELQQVGLPEFRPPGTQPLPLYLPIPEFGSTIIEFLRQYLRGATVLDELVRAADEVQRLVPIAQRSETHARVLAGVLPILQLRAREAQSPLGPELVHGWVIFHNAVREAQEVLDERARERLDAACEATAVYQDRMKRVNDEIDARGGLEVEAHQLVRAMMESPTPFSSRCSTPPTPSSPDMPDFSMLRLGLDDATMDLAQLEMAAMHLGEERSGPAASSVDEGDEGGMTAERESMVSSWEEHVHEASFWGVPSPSASLWGVLSPTPSATSSSNILGVQPWHTIDVQTPSSSYSVVDEEPAGAASLFSGEPYERGFDSANKGNLVSSSEDSQDEQVQQYLQQARDLGHEGRYDEAQEYWWAALKCVARHVVPASDELTYSGTDSDDDLSPLNFGSALSSPTHEPAASLGIDSGHWPQGLSISPVSIPVVWSDVIVGEDEAGLDLESLIHSRLIEAATTTLRDEEEADNVRVPLRNHPLHVATTFVPPLPAAVFEGKQDPRPWYRVDPPYLDNNPVWESYHNQPTYDDLPTLKMSDYAKAGAFERAPLHQGLRKLSRSASAPLSTAITPPSSSPPTPDPASPPDSPTMTPQPFTWLIADLRRHLFPYEGESVGGRMFDEFAEITRALDVEHALAFSWLHKAVHLAYDQRGMGQLVDYERMQEPDGQRVEFDWDVFEKPIVVDAERDELKEHFFCEYLQFFRAAAETQGISDGNHFDLLQVAYDLRQSLLSTVRLALPFLGRQGADLTHAFYKWLQAHRYATRRRFFWVFPLLHRHEMGLCETLYSLLVDHGYSREADELWRVLRVRYVCEDVLGRFLRDGFLDIPRQHGDAEYWTRDLPGLVYGDQLLTLSGDEEQSSDEQVETPDSISSSDASFSYFTGVNYQDVEYRYSSDEESIVDGADEAFFNFSLALSGPRLPRAGFNLTLPTPRRSAIAVLEDLDIRPEIVDTRATPDHDAESVATGGNDAAGKEGNSATKA
ncbi:hypothetical protein C8F01DRAFT_1084561 [Mycena amicta]|nr:hypothetical protein C8F01DRAFT_1084561 [Mycena amicta]